MQDGNARVGCPGPILARSGNPQRRSSRGSYGVAGAPASHADRSAHFPLAQMGQKLGQICAPPCTLRRPVRDPYLGGKHVIGRDLGQRVGLASVRLIDGRRRWIGVERAPLSLQELQVFPPHRGQFRAGISHLLDRGQAFEAAAARKAVGQQLPEAGGQRTAAGLLDQQIFKSDLIPRHRTLKIGPKCAALMPHFWVASGR